MAVLRAALGVEQLTSLGQRSGPPLGAAYAEMFPANVRAMALDAAYAPTHGPLAARLFPSNPRPLVQRHPPHLAAADEVLPRPPLPRAAVDAVLAGAG